VETEAETRRGSRCGEMEPGTVGTATTIRGERPGTVLSLAADVHAPINDDREPNTNPMVGLAVADVLVAAALVPDVTI
jgi:hypothetical protein